MAANYCRRNERISSWLKIIRRPRRPPRSKKRPRPRPSRPSRSSSRPRLSRRLRRRRSPSIRHPGGGALPRRPGWRFLAFDFHATRALSLSTRRPGSVVRLALQGADGRREAGEEGRAGNAGWRHGRHGLLGRVPEFDPEPGRRHARHVGRPAGRQSPPLARLDSGRSAGCTAPAAQEENLEL